MNQLTKIDAARLLRPWQTRTHCCGHIVAHDVSWAAQTGKHLRTQNVSEQNQKHFLCPRHKICVRNKCCVRGQTGKHLCREQCVRNNVSSFARAFKQDITYLSTPCGNHTITHFCGTNKAIHNHAQSSHVQHNRNVIEKLGKISLLANKYLWKFLSRAHCLMQVPGCTVAHSAGNTYRRKLARLITQYRDMFFRYFGRHGIPSSASYRE